LKTANGKALNYNKVEKPPLKGKGKTAEEGRLFAARVQPSAQSYFVTRGAPVGGLRERGGRLGGVDFRWSSGERVEGVAFIVRFFFLCSAYDSVMRSGEGWGFGQRSNLRPFQRGWVVTCFQKPAIR